MFFYTNLKDSLRQDSRYFIWPRSADVAALSDPWKIPSSSAWQRRWISGWLANRNRLKVMLAAVVSWPSNMKVSTSSRMSSSESTVPPFDSLISRSSKADRRLMPVVAAASSGSAVDSSSASAAASSAFRSCLLGEVRTANYFQIVIS